MGEYDSMFMQYFDGLDLWPCECNAQRRTIIIIFHIDIEACPLRVTGKHEIE